MTTTPPPPKPPLRKTKSFTPTELIVLSTAGLLVSFGLCGLMRDPFVGLGMMLFAVSGIGFLGAVLWSIFESIFGSRKP